MKIRDVAIIILYDSNGRMLLQFRDEGAPILAMHWACFGGGIDEGESPERAVFRETKEELDYSLSKPKLVLVEDYEIENQRGKHYVYTEECGDKTSLKLQEGGDWGWFKFSEMATLKMAALHSNLLERVEKLLIDDHGRIEP